MHDEFHAYAVQLYQQPCQTLVLYFSLTPESVSSYSIASTRPFLNGGPDPYDETLIILACYPLCYCNYSHNEIL